MGSLIQILEVLMFKLRSVCFVFLGCIFVTGCSHPKWNQPVVAWSALAPARLTTIQAAYTTINTVDTQRQQQDLVASYPQQGFQPSTIKQFVADTDLQARTQAMQSLQKYAAILSVLGSGSKSGVPSTAAALGFPLAVPATKLSLTGPEQTALNNMIDAVAINIMDRKIDKQLPSIVEKADPVIQEFSDLVTKDINDFEMQAEADYQLELMQQNEFIKANQSQLSPSSLKTEISQLSIIEQQQQATQQQFEAAKAAAQQLGQEHHTLMLSMETKK